MSSTKKIKKQPGKRKIDLSADRNQQLIQLVRDFSDFYPKNTIRKSLWQVLRLAIQGYELQDLTCDLENNPYEFVFLYDRIVDLIEGMQEIVPNINTN